MSRLSIPCLAGAVLALSTAACFAGEPYVDFLRGLQNRGYGEQALDYLETIAGRPDLPEELRSTLDLERSKSLRIAANEAYDQQQRDSRLAEAKRLAEKFAKENPNHPQAGAAILSEADDTLLRGQMSLAESRVVKEPEAQAKALAAAKEALERCKKQYEDAVTGLKAQLDAMPEPERGKRDVAREEIEYSWLDARFKSALSAYFLAQTITDPMAKERKALLESAGKGFDAIFQEYRTSGKPIAMLPHMWHGKVLEDLNQRLDAIDVYDEVLGLMPDPKEATAKNADLAPLFAQAFLFRLRMVASDEEVETKDVIAEGQKFLDDYKGWQLTDAYQGVAVEVAKAKLELVEKARTPSERTKLLREISQTLLAVGKIDSTYKQEALLLRRDAQAKQGATGTMTADDRLALVDEAMAQKNWTEAEKLCREVVAQATEKKEAKRLSEAKARLAEILYQVAGAHYSAGEMEKVLTAARDALASNPDAEATQNAMSLAVFASLSLFTEAKDPKAKDTELKRLDQLARYTIEHWPDSPAGDEARMALAQSCIARQDYASAIELFAAVAPQSKRYPTAMQFLGQIRWKQYLDAKKQPDAADKPDEIAALREQAVASLKTSVERQQAGRQSGDPLSPALFDAQLLLGETYVEADQPGEAAALLAPLVDEIARTKPTELNLKIQRTYVYAVRAQLAAGQAEAAGDAALALANMSPDEPQPNGLIVDLAKLMAIEIRRIEAEQAADAAGFQGVSAKAEATAKLREAQGQLLDAIVGRKALSIQQLIFVGDACVDLGKNQMAREIYSRLLDSIDKDAEAKKTAGPAVTRIRSRQVGLLRAEGKLDEAYKQVDALLKAHPNAMEPMLEKGYILEAMAERNPKRTAEAVAHWTDLRLRLQKTKPPEYYEVLYNCARCLVRQARAAKDKEAALTAEKMLKSTLVLSPKLSGADMVAKYQALLKAAMALQGKAITPTTPASSGLKPVVPTTPTGAKKS